MLFFLTKNEFAKIRNLFWNNEHISFQNQHLFALQASTY